MIQHDSKPKEHDPTKLHVQLGIGGAGKLAILLFLRMFWDKFQQSLRNLIVDTDKTDIEGLAKWQKFLMVDFPVAAFLRKLRNDPASIPGDGLADRVSQYRKGLGGSESINSGLQTMRLLGWALLSFYLNRYAVELNYFLLSPINQLHHYVADRCKQRGLSNIQDKLELTITLVFSTAGGTGSSIGILIANYLHKIVRERGGFTRFSLEADILLPGPMIHRAVNASLLLGNTFATLVEILRPYALDEAELPRIMLGKIDLIRRQLFRRIYLYDGINLGGYTLNSRELVCQIRNAVYLLRSFGQEAAEYRARLADIHVAYPNIYSSAGACIIQFDAAHITRMFQERTGMAWLARLTERMPETQAHAQAEAYLSDFLEAHPGWQTVPAFVTDSSGAPLRMQLPSSKRGFRKIRAQIAGRFNHYKQRWQDTLNQLVAQSIEEQSHSLRHALSQLANQPMGISLAVAFLRVLSERLQHQQTQIEMQLQESKRQLAQVQASSQQQLKGLAHLFGSKQPSAAIYQQLADGELNHKRHQAQAHYCKQVLALIEGYVENMQGLRATFIAFEEAIDGRHQQYLEDYTNRQSIAVQSVVCPDEADGWYQEQVEDALTQVSQQLWIGWLEKDERFGLLQQGSEPQSRCLILSKEGMNRFLEECAQPWNGLKDKTVEGILKEQGRTPESIFAEMEKAATPLISIAEEECIPEPQRLLVLATETEHFFKTLPEQTGLTTTATGNPHQMSLLFTIHGLAMEHLTKYSDFKHAYDVAMAEGRNLHVYPDDALLQPQTKKRRRRSSAKPASGDVIAVPPDADTQQQSD
ncbi:MAG: tubulin-like doman-containing protein [Chloroflexota bacterium]